MGRGLGCTQGLYMGRLCAGAKPCPPSLHHLPHSLIMNPLPLASCLQDMPSLNPNIPPSLMYVCMSLTPKLQNPHCPCPCTDKGSICIACKMSMWMHALATTRPPAQTLSQRAASYRVVCWMQLFLVESWKRQGQVLLGGHRHRAASLQNSVALPNAAGESGCVCPLFHVPRSHRCTPTIRSG